MLNYYQALPKDISIQDLQIKEVRPIMKLIVRGRKREFISAIGKVLNILRHFNPWRLDFLFRIAPKFFEIPETSEKFSE